jgi:hypothetical protein
MIGWQVNDGEEQTRTNIHALSGIQTHGLSIQAIKTMLHTTWPLELALLWGYHGYFHYYDC